MTQQIVDLTQENQQYKQAIRQMETKAERHLTTINELKQDSEDQQQQIINLYSKINEQAKDHEDERLLANEKHDEEVSELKQKNTLEKKQLLKVLSKKFIGEK